MSTWTDQNILFLNLPTDQFLTILAYGEAGNQGSDGMTAVLNVVKNRTRTQSFYDQEIYSMTNDAYKAVGLKQKQFSMFNLNDPVRVTAEKIANNFQGNLSTNSAIQNAYALSHKLLTGTLTDNSGGATNYFASYASIPSWASVLSFIKQIGQHLFYAISPSDAGAAELEPTSAPIMWDWSWEDIYGVPQTETSSMYDWDLPSIESWYAQEYPEIYVVEDAPDWVKEWVTEYQPQTILDVPEEGQIWVRQAVLQNQPSSASMSLIIPIGIGIGLLYLILRR